LLKVLIIITKIEHVNSTFSNIYAVVIVLNIVALDFEIRKDEKPLNDKRGMHIGNNEFYFELQEAHLLTIPKKAK